MNKDSDYVGEGFTYRGIVVDDRVRPNHVELQREYTKLVCERFFVEAEALGFKRDYMCRCALPIRRPWYVRLWRWVVEAFHEWSW